MGGPSLGKLQITSLSIGILVGGAVAAGGVVFGESRALRGLVVAFAFLLTALVVKRAHVLAMRRLRALEQAIANVHWTQHLPVVSSDPLASIEATFDALVDGLASYHAERTAATDMITRLMACDTQDEVLRLLRRALRKVFPNDGGALYLGYPDGSRYLRVINFRMDEAEEVLDHDHCAAVASGREGDAQCTHAGALVRECYPLHSRGRIIGVLTVRYDSSSLDDYGEVRAPRRLLAEAVARQIGLVLTNLQLRTALEELSTRDALTGAFNRRYFDETIVRALADAERKDEPLSVVMIDVDHFKRFNDRYGHPAGDTLLKHVAGVLAQTVRAGDLVCRFGGEEFVVLLAGAPPPVAFARAEELRLAVSALAVAHDGLPLGAVTASLGVASTPQHGASPTELVDAADRALYRAKEGGRNRVCLAELPARAGEIAA